MSVFIAQLVPWKSKKAIKGISQAAMNYCHNFINAVSPEKVYALLLISERKKQHFDYDNPTIVFIQTRLFPHIGILRFFNAFIENIRIFIAIMVKNENDIWFYNLNQHTWIVFVLLKIFRKRCFLIFADFDPGLRSNVISKWLIGRFDGIISFSQGASYLFPKIHHVKILPGIFNVTCDLPGNKTICKTKVLFSGSLSKHAGIDLALETFSKLPQINLVITGSGSEEGKISEYCKKYANISYLGNMNYADYLNILKEIDITLSLRNPSFSENIYNFPSKILDFFISGKIVISTVKYSSLPDSSYFYCDYNSDSLGIVINKICSLNDSQLQTVVSNAREYVGQELSYEAWHKSVLEIEALTKKPK